MKQREEGTSCDHSRTVKQWCAKLRSVATLTHLPVSTEMPLQQEQVQRSSVLRVPGSRALVMALQTALNRITLYRLGAGGGVRGPAAVDGDGEATERPTDPFGSVVLQEEEGNCITCMTLVRHDFSGRSFVTLWVGTSNGTMLVADANVDGRVLVVCQFPRKLTSSYNVAHEHDAVVAICPSSVTSSLLANPWLTLSDGATVGDGPQCYTKNIDVVHASGYCVCVREDALEELLRSTYASHGSTVYQETKWPRPCLTHDWDRQRVAFPYAGTLGNFARGLRDSWVLAATPRDEGEGGHPTIRSACSAMLPAGGGSSALALLDAASTVKSQRLLFTVQSSEAVVAYSLHNKAAAPLSTGRAAIEIAGRLTGAALKAVKGFWSRSRTSDGPPHAAAGSSGPAEELVVHGDVRCDSDLPLRGVSMEGSLQLSPAAKYAAICSSSGRVLVFDTISQTLCKVLKGCRNASVQWLQLPQNPQRTGAPRADLVLAVYLPLRGVLEFHRMSTAQRICAVRVGSVTLLQVESCSTLLLHELFVLEHGAAGGCGGRVRRISLRSMEAFSERHNRLQMLRALQPKEGTAAEPSAAALARFVGVGVSTTLLAVIRGALEQLSVTWRSLHEWLVASEGHSVQRAQELIRLRTESDLWALWEQMYAFVRSLPAPQLTASSQSSLASSPPLAPSDARASTDAPNVATASVVVTAEDLCEASEVLLHTWSLALGVPVPFSEVVSTRELNPSSASHRYHCILQLKRLGEAFLALCAARQECGREQVGATESDAGEARCGEGKSPLGSDRDPAASSPSSSSSYTASVTSFFGAAFSKRAEGPSSSVPALSATLAEGLRRLAASPAERAWLESDEVAWSLWNRAIQGAASWIDVSECVVPHPLAPRRLLPATVAPHFPSFLRCFTPSEPRIGLSPAHARALSNVVHDVRLALAHDRNYEDDPEQRLRNESTARQTNTDDDTPLLDLQHLTLTFLDDSCAVSKSLSGFLKQQSVVLSSLGVHGGSIAQLMLMFLTSPAFAGLGWEWTDTAASAPVLRAAAVVGLARVLPVDTLVNWVAVAPFAPAKKLMDDVVSRPTQASKPKPVVAAQQSTSPLPPQWTCWPTVLERIALLVLKAVFTPDSAARVALMSRVTHLIAAGILLDEALQHNRSNPAISQSCCIVLKTDSQSPRLEHPLHWIFDILVAPEGSALEALPMEEQQNSIVPLLPGSRLPKWISEWSFRWTKEFPLTFLDAWQALHMLGRHTASDTAPFGVLRGSREASASPFSAAPLPLPGKTWDDKRFVEECLTWYDASVYQSTASTAPIASHSMSHPAIESDCGVMRVVTLFAMSAALLGPISVALRASGATAEDRWFALVDLGSFMANSSSRSALAYLRSCTAVVRKLLKEYHDVFGRRLLSLADVATHLRDMDAVQHTAAPSAVFHIYPMEYRAAVRQFCAFSAAHLDGHEACFLDLLDVVSIVELVAWNASIGPQLSIERGGDTVAWTSMFSVSSLSLLDEKTVYPHLAEELLASMAAQRQTSRLHFLYRQVVRYVLGAGTLHVLIETATTALQPLVSALQLDSQQARAVLEITVLSHWMKTSDFNDASAAAIQQLVQTSSVRVLLAKALLPWMRRYVYATVKWFVALEKSIPPDSKERRVRHAANSSRIRSAMTPRFEAWLRQRGPTSSVSHPSPERPFQDNADVPLEWFYEGSSDDARVDSNLRRLVGLHKVKGLLNVLALLAEFCKVELAAQADSIGDDLRTVVLVIHTVVGSCM